MGIATAGIKKIVLINTAILFGLTGCKQPVKEPAVIEVYVSYTGADSTKIKLTVLDPLQKEIAKISNIHKISASSQNGYGNIIVEFNTDKNIDSATIQVQNRLTVTSANLPQEAKIYSFRMNKNDKKNKNNQ